jgi:hypothetical protein
LGDSTPTAQDHRKGKRGMVTAVDGKCEGCTAVFDAL